MKDIFLSQKQEKERLLGGDYIERIQVKNASKSQLLSRELGTHLTGRYLEYKILPLAKQRARNSNYFSDFCQWDRRYNETK